MTVATEYTVHLRKAFNKQRDFKNSKAKRKIIRAGRRGGKTTGAAIVALEAFLNGKRVLYAAPTSEQVGKFWYEINRALAEPVDAGVYKKNEAENYIEVSGTENRIKAKTAWNASTLRGDFADLLIFDEFQLMAEDAWDEVGVPMLLDNNGDAMFIYTPPSLKSSGISRARDPRHAAKMFKTAREDTSGRWEAFHFTSHDNPHISEEALREIIKDMSRESYFKEIMAEDDELQVSWLVYGAFHENTCWIEPFPIPKEWPRYSGHDFGSANPAALFIAEDSNTGFFYAYEEYLPGAGRSTAHNVAEFKRITQGVNVIRRVGGSHQEEEIRQGYTAHGWPIQEPKINSANAQIDRVKALMELNKLYVFKSLVHYHDELMNCMWKLDEQGATTNEIKDEKKYHLCACARYLLSDFTPETVEQDKPPEVRYY